jgi:hypothetical protein
LKIKSLPPVGRLGVINKYRWYNILMKRYFVGVSIVAVILLVFLLLFLFRSQPQNVTENRNDVVQSSTANEETARPSDEEAENTGFNFILDFIKTAPPESDEQALDRAYEALSQNAKSQVSQVTLSRDLAGFVGVQDVPDGGASVEDLQIEGETAILIVGLNYSGGRVLRAVNMVIEDGSWKVDSINPLDEYPLEN